MPHQPSGRVVAAAVAVTASLLLALGVLGSAGGGAPSSPAAAPAPPATPARKPAPRPTPTAKPTPKPSPAATRRPATRPPAPRPSTPSGVPVRGRILDVNGRPVAGARVSMTEMSSVWFPIGLDEGTAVTSSRGEYTLYLDRYGARYLYDVDFPGGSLQAEVAYDGKPRRMPDVRVWSPSPRLTTSGRTATLRFRHAPAVLGHVESYTGGATLRPSGDAVVTLYSIEDGETFDARLMEDARVRAFVTATITTRLGRTTFGGVHDTRGTLRPGSRGRPCFEHGPGTRYAPGTAACRRVVDGNLVNEWAPPSQPCSQSDCDRFVGVDLGASRRIRMVHVRNCSGFPDVETSDDGRSWERLEEAVDCVYDVDVTARYVRVGGSFAHDVNELSVWY